MYLITSGKMGISIWRKQYVATLKKPSTFNFLVQYLGGGQNLERRNVERQVFRNFEISNIKFRVFHNFIFEFIFYFL